MHVYTSHKSSYFSTYHSSIHIIIILTQDGSTPLFIASLKGYSDVMHTLIFNGADLDLAFKVSVKVTGILIVVFHFRLTFYVPQALDTFTSDRDS